MDSKEKEYWDKRYRLGGTSGAGSVGEYRAWKWNIINEFLPAVDNVIDVGCGDLSFWEGRDCREYTGIDLSSTVVERNRTLRPGWKFIASPAGERIEGLHGQYILCFDMLFHVMEPADYVSILENLCRYSTSHIFVYNWMRNPWTRSRTKSAVNLFQLISRLHFVEAGFAFKSVVFNPVTDGKYQYYRPLENYLHIFTSNGFHLAGKKECFDNIGAMYIFKKD
jgi:2-polyprenyl-3-methyl-5-hydroxy-6-metoxy-1,4-benzoquinol methylase